MLETKKDKWTEIEHLPEWDEEFYNIYTAKKFGKWVMLKTLKEEYKQKPEFQAMMEKEFDVRYNLAHPNIIVINDYEEVPGIGMCIITDDVYGDSLRKLINENRITQEIVEKLSHQLVDAMEYIQANHIVHHPIRPETIIFTEIGGTLKLIDVGFDQKSHLEPADAMDDIYNFGKVLDEVLDCMQEKDAHLRKIADRCLASSEKRFRDVQALQLAINNRSSSRLYAIVIAFLMIMIAFLVWFASPWGPEKTLSQNEIIKEQIVSPQNE